MLTRIHVKYGIEWPGGRHLLTLLLIFVPAAGSAYAAVEINVTQIGYPSLRGASVVRNGAWTPVVADLALINEAAFDGTLRVAQRDSDGDRCFDSVEIHLRRESGGTQRAWLYALTNARREANKFELQLFDANGETVKVVSQGEVATTAAPAEQPTVISDDDWLVLSLSTRPVGRIRELLSVPEGSDLDPSRTASFRREPHVVHIAPTDLPEHWLGLEMADAAVWEDAKADDLNERQREALLEWVRQGGHLLIASSRYAGSLALSPALEAVLPVRIGEVTTADNLPDFRREYVSKPSLEPGQVEDPIPWYEVKFPQPVPVARCRTKPGAELLAYEEDALSDVAAKRRVGRGEITFLAVTTNDLLSAPGGAAGFFQRVFALAALEESERSVRPNGISVFDKVAGAVSFATSGGLYLLLATLASMAYVAISTWGTWQFLSLRGWRHHSWTAFALTAALASVATVLAVNFQRGFGDSLHQLCVLDADAGSSQASGVCLFGVRTTADKQIDLWLPPDSLAATQPAATACFLRPIPGANDQLALATSFVDPEEYRVIPASAVVDDVRIRATLKQFEGRWKGPLGGKLSGEIQVRRGLMTDASYLINELGVELKQCLLIQPTTNLVPPYRTRSDIIQLFDIGDLPADGTRVPLAPRCYRPASDETLAQFLVRSTLADAHREWKNVVSIIDLSAAGSVRYARGEEKRALLLSSTLGELSPQSLAGAMDQFTGARTVSRDRLRSLDLRAQLEAGAAAGESSPAREGGAILIGFADHSGPARLFRREGDGKFQLLNPDPRYSTTMYRVRIPIRVLEGGSYRPTTAEEEETE